VLAPRGAFEVGMNAGYLRPFGSIAGGRPAGHVADSGLGLGLDLGYRVSPRFGIGWSGQFHESRAAEELARGTDVRGLANSIQGTYHFRPYERLDPYLSAGAGYRLLWQRSPVNGGDLMTHGFQLAKLQAGLDVRVSPDVAVGPFVAGDLDLFVWNEPEGPGGSVQIADQKLSTFLYGGVQARFDIGGRREGMAEVIARRRLVPSPYFQAEVPPAPRGQGLPPSEVSIEPSLMAACGIGEPKAYFSFDSAELRVQQEGPLDRLAACLTTGALRGQSLEIVGHTDPRGPDEYNQQLGHSRADSVANYLTARGMSSARVNTKSVGEQQATGTEPQGWAHDRRVDIRLAK
jgi:outer membrane protein OmpA-like peptidoglycan-associated protein